MFEENERFVDPRTNLTSYNWGPSDKTLERWRKVYDFIRNVESLQDAPRQRNKVTHYLALFSVAASIHRCPGGLVAGLNPLQAVHPREWKDDLRSFKDEFLKCVHLFHNAVIHSYIKNLPKFLLERTWTGSNSSSILPKLTLHESSSTTVRNQQSSHMPTSLFETKSLAVHPPYRFKLALERCGKTEGHQINVSQRGKVQLRFNVKNNLFITTDIKLGPLIAPLEKDDKRTIHFTGLGIDIRTATGWTIKVPINNSRCTLPLSALKSHKNGTEFIRLWKAVRGEAQPERGLSCLLKSSDEDTDYPLELCVSSNGEKGAKPPQKRLETFQEPGKNDAMWLLKSYIDSYLPDGGDFWTGNKVDFPQGTDDVARFIE
ncbi:hypothetical protein FAGAP_11442 [Fusarium agapanthi]|uniref:Uncharacterized protein n=1 Tax=Fusarium agapanthi TaxID=1803897 RepID=A0A9P5AZW3_9HYPO|nr:hypothetical protein FAGAP_11442 [Fusarium agapanthi]